ncbi:interferon gamma [Erinaceus europaeus]|uniref:Interferon gamma n=1 Tax=Erinaceus europaeus TaxID=9365 RepID=A0A1S3A2V7_ERIEU|nr:interferon gamma [Erinaceus europaeus]
MKYAGYILALQLCVMLSSSSSCMVGIIKEIDKLKEYFNATSSSVASGGTLFLDTMKKWKEESDKIIQSQVISFYFKLFESVQDNQIQSALNSVKEELVVKFFNGNLSKREDFEKLANISMNDGMVQRRAISELDNVIHSLLPCQRKRKRSQTQFRGRRNNEYSVSSGRSGGNQGEKSEGYVVSLKLAMITNLNKDIEYNEVPFLYILNNITQKQLSAFDFSLPTNGESNSEQAFEGLLLSSFCGLFFLLHSQQCTIF